jgi:hypothetical protein
VSGSVRSSADRVRVNVQLIEAESGGQLWAGHYDVERGNTLELQDDIARRIMIELEPAVTKADFSVIRRRRIDSAVAWSLFRQAVGTIGRTAIDGRCSRSDGATFSSAIVSIGSFAGRPTNRYPTRGIFVIQSPPSGVWALVAS